MNTENNKLIAEFMGLQPDHCELYLIENNNKVEFAQTYQEADEYLTLEGGIIRIKFKADELQYSSDWNWLMEVVEKIESENVVCFITQGSNCTIKGNFKFGITSASKIQAVYNACLEFIKWYNEQKK